MTRTLLALALLLTLAASLRAAERVGYDTPEAAATAFLTNMKDKKYDAAVLQSLGADTPENVAMMDKIMSAYHVEGFTVGSATISGDQASLPVTLTGASFDKAVFKTAMTDIMKAKMAEQPMPPEQQEMMDKMMTPMIAQVADQSAATFAENLKKPMILSKVEGKWYIGGKEGGGLFDGPKAPAGGRGAP